MKKMKKITLLLLFLGISVFAFAQGPYRNAVGIHVGSFNGLTYKTFLSGSTALQIDAGLKLNFPGNDEGLVLGIEVNPNAMYQMEFNRVSGLYWLLGGGATLGVRTSKYSALKLGVNAIGGLEYKFRIPFAIQLDLRPGFGFIAGENAHGYFDWIASLGFRYTF